MALNSERTRLGVLATLLFSLVFALVAPVALAARAEAQSAPASVGNAGAAQARDNTASGVPTLQEARQFIDHVNQRLEELSTNAGRAAWVQATYITDDTEMLAADYNEQLIAETTRFIHQAQRFKNLQMPPELRRQFELLDLSLTMPAPDNAKEREELTQIASKLEGSYGSGKYCPKSGPYEGKCLGQSDMEEAFATTRDPDVLKDLWVGWRTISPGLRQPYSRLVELSNKGAVELGYDNTGDLWKSNYDMTPAEFTQQIHQLWDQVRPLYESLHAYIRRRLVEKYGQQAETPDGMIRADLLGNIWGQEWGNIYDLVAPPRTTESYDLTKLLQARNLKPKDMVKYGENFFLSLGFQPLPETFWERSLFTKPRDRDVVCHASAWDVDNKDDLRLKMCIQIRADDFITVHHELGHNFYQRAYNQLPLLFRNGANDGFHEAIGDTIALSITPDYLKKVNLLDTDPAGNQGRGDWTAVAPGPR